MQLLILLFINLEYVLDDSYYYNEGIEDIKAILHEIVDAKSSDFQERLNCEDCSKDVLNSLIELGLFRADFKGIARQNICVHQNHHHNCYVED